MPVVFRNSFIISVVTDPAMLLLFCVYTSVVRVQMRQTPVSLLYISIEIHILTLIKMVVITAIQVLSS